MPSNTSTILHKRNSISGVSPSVNSLSAGELAINTTDGKIFTKTENNSIKTFLNSEQLPYTLNSELSSINFQYGNNSVNAPMSVILGGDNNTINHRESYILGSNITTHLSGFTYVNNISATGSYYGDGSNLKGIIAEGVSGPDTQVRSLTSNWENTYTLVQSESSNWGGSQATLKRHDFIEEYDYSISYCGTALYGSLENSEVWNVSKIIYTSMGTVSSIKNANNITWTGRLTASYF